MEVRLNAAFLTPVEFPIGLLSHNTQIMVLESGFGPRAFLNLETLQSVHLGARV